ncbi:DNA glycosylase [Gongronella butleri]|nr:DNA glycosylase [Gongronella butleri]
MLRRSTRLQGIVKKYYKIRQPNRKTAVRSITQVKTVVVSSINRKYNIDDAWQYLKNKDTALAAFMDEDALCDFKQHLASSNGNNPFKSLTTDIMYQQIHGKAAQSIRDRFLRLFDSPVPFPDSVIPSSFPWFPTPAMVLTKSIVDLRAAGLSQRKAEYIRDLASKFDDNTITDAKLETLSDEEISKLLCSVRGIGQWTVDMFLMFNLCHPDVLPVGDLGVRRGVSVHFKHSKGKSSAKKKKHDDLPSPKDMQELTEIWSPYRTIGSWMMWRVLDVKTVAE